MSFCDRDNERNQKIIWKSKGLNSAENYSTGSKFKIDLCILKTNLDVCTIFHLKISMYDRENERKINWITERGNTVCPANFMAGA